MPIGLYRGVFSTMLGLAGAGAVILWPNQAFLGYLLFASAAMLFCWGVTLDGAHWWAKSRFFMTWPYALMLFSMIGFVFGAWGALRTKVSTESADNREKHSVSLEMAMAWAKYDVAHAISQLDLTHDSAEKSIREKSLMANKRDKSGSELSKEYNHMGDNYVNHGINNGHIGPVNNNFGKMPFDMSEGTMADIANRLGVPHALTVQWVGGERSKAAALQLGSYLKERGFQITYGEIGVLVPALEHPIELRSDGVYVDVSR
jgi:hypothetical protein